MIEIGIILTLVVLAVIYNNSLFAIIMAWFGIILMAVFVYAAYMNARQRYINRNKHGRKLT